MGKQMKIYEFITTELNPNADVEFDADMDLFENEVLESMSMIELIVWLEDTFGIEVETEDLTPENFCSLNAMAAYVEWAASAAA